MKIEHLSLLCDPETHEDLTLEGATIKDNEIISGMLVSSSNRYPIINGIPRFVENEGYSDNFGYQWNRWARVQFEDQNKGGPMENHTINMFKSISGLSGQALKGKTVLDMGCGPGRFTDVAKSMGATVIALDYSSAIDAARENFKETRSDIIFIQGDALKLPIKTQSLDYVFSIGVLHHTPAPEKGVREAWRALRNGGEFSIRVYGFGANGFYTFPTVKMWRAIFQFLKPIFKHYPPLVYSYLFGTIGYGLGKVWRPLSYPIRVFFPTAWEPDYRWAILDTFDAIATTFQSGHTPEEVEKWLRSSGFEVINHRQGNDFVARK
jgi:ubiquinone/menaquinone biosynthesis C-methylase UbiE/uncharacterized protein YbaR (Trm112 family)